MGLVHPHPSTRAPLDPREAGNVTADIDAIVAATDVDGDGNITFAEFRNAMLAGNRPSAKEDAEVRLAFTRVVLGWY